MPDEKDNLMETEEYERFRRAVQSRIDAGALDAAEARRIVESVLRQSHEEDNPAG